MESEVGYKNLTTPDSKDAAKRALLSNIKEALEADIVRGAEIYNHISNLADYGATQDEIDAAFAKWDDDDGVSFDDNPWASRAGEGYWVHAWVWVDQEENETAK